MDKVERDQEIKGNVEIFKRGQNGLQPSDSRGSKVALWMT